MFYFRLFNVEFVKCKFGYVNFVIVDLLFKLVLLENFGIGGIFNYFGVEVGLSNIVYVEIVWLIEVGLVIEKEIGIMCCFVI